MQIDVKLDEMDYAYVHDVLIEATWDEDSKKGKDFSNEEIDLILKDVPKNIISIAYSWGFGDTVFRDNLYEWYEGLKETQE